MNTTEISPVLGIHNLLCIRIYMKTLPSFGFVDTHPHTIPCLLYLRYEDLRSCSIETLEFCICTGIVNYFGLEALIPI